MKCKIHKCDLDWQKCSDCGYETLSPTGLCYECWFKRGSPAHVKMEVA
jgi:hypothetical protein